MMMPSNIRLKLQIVIVGILISLVYSEIPRSSCRDHYLANIRKSQVLPIELDGDVTANILCEMDESETSETFITTVIESGISHSVMISDRKSINYQIPDLNWIREQLKTSYCTQELTVDWSNVPEENRASIQIISLLNEAMNITYDPETPTVTMNLVHVQAGLRHVFTTGSVQLQSSPLRCQQSLVQEEQCLFKRKIQLDLFTRNWKFAFAFRTDRENPKFLSLNGADGALQIKLENDYFVTIDENITHGVSLLTDFNWHTVTIGPDNAITIDKHIIPLNKALSLYTYLTINVLGEVLLVDSKDTRDKCIPFNEEVRTLGQIDLDPVCIGCECPILKSSFSALLPPSCEPSEEDTYHLLRDSDRLSFFHIPYPSSYSLDNESVQSAIAFKSDSDAGLLLFGYWNYVTRGRWQVHYRGSRMTAIICIHDGEEELCRQCSTINNEGFGKDKWHRAVFYNKDSDYFLISDSEICKLEAIQIHKNVSIAELYSVPNIVNSGGLFIGGTYYEIKNSGMYMNDITIKYLENTREKIPSLRGCIKDVFMFGHRVDLTVAYDNQRKHMLHDPTDLQAFAILVGCVLCEPGCQSNVRCRTPSPHTPAVGKCDCSDIYGIETSDGECRQRNGVVIPLSTKYVNSIPIIISLTPTRSIIESIWIKFKLPQSFKNNLIIAEFNNHREMLFRVYATADGRINVQITPHDQTYFEPDAYKSTFENDDRVHLLVVRRQTPIGTKHNNQRYELIIDGSRFELPDYSRSMLNNITFHPLEGADISNSVILHDVGVGYETDEHAFYKSKSNKLHQVDVFERIMQYVSEYPDSDEYSGTVDPYLWQEEPEFSHEYSESQNMKDNSYSSSPHGSVDAYTPDTFQPQYLLPVSARVLFYSMIICASILILILFCFCCCMIRRRGRSTRRSTESDRVNMLSSSPDYPVKLRREFIDTSSLHDDCSIGTDDTDLNAYRDINSHRVKVYRESMVSILVPSLDHTQEAAIVKRESINDVIPPTPPFSASPAPLVNVGEDD